MHFILLQGILLQLGNLGTGGFHPKMLPASEDNWWIAVLLFACFTMLTMLRVFDYRRLVLLFNGFIRLSSVTTIYREEYSISSRVSVFLLLNYLLVMALFASNAAHYAGVPTSGLSSVGMIALAIGAAYFVKIVVIRLMGRIFELKEAAKEYVYNILLFNKATGIVLFPIVLLLAYARQLPSEWLLWAGFVSIGIILAYRLLRLILIGIGTSTVSFLYLILYLCTLELLPFVVIIKVFVVKFNPFHP